MEQHKKEPPLKPLLKTGGVLGAPVQGSYFFYHNGALPTDGSYRRSICVDYMYYNPGGTIQKIIQTKQGVLPVASETAKKTKKEEQR